MEIDEKKFQGQAMSEEERWDETSGVHARAMLKVSQSLTEDETSSFKTFLVNLKREYTKRIEHTKDFQKISGVLLSGGNIKHGKYTFLKDLFDQFGRLDLVDVLSDAEQEIAKQNANNSKILLHHADLVVELKRTITPSQLETLILFFREIYSDGEMDEINSFNEMWKVLIRRGEVSPGRYGILERALRSIQATSHLQVINEFNEKIKSEDGRYDGWIREDIVVKSVEELTELKDDDYRRSFEKGKPGVLFKNAAIGNIGEEGGELRLTNGSVNLDIPPGAVDRKSLFWMFAGQDGCPQFFLKSANGQVADSNIIAKYSIPVRLGPTDVQFRTPVRLKVKDFSRPPSENGFPKSMSVYRKVDGDTEWNPIGSCFYDADSNNNMTASVSLNHFSTYVLGMPVSSDLLPLNVRVMVQSRSMKADAGNAANEIHVFFTVNDYSFCQELVLHNWIHVDSATYLYLDPKHDVSVSWVRRHYVQKSVRCIKKEILHMEHVQNLADAPVSLEVAVIDGSDLADMIETESEFESILILEQNGTVLVELPFTESTRALETSAKHPTDHSPEEIIQVKDLSKRLFRATLGVNKNKVQRLFNEGANIETRDEEGNTLSLASNRGLTAAIQLLADAETSYYGYIKKLKLLDGKGISGKFQSVKNLLTPSRPFLLLINRGCLYYFKDDTAKKPRGSCTLYGYNRILQAEKLRTDKRPWVFQIEHVSPLMKTLAFSTLTKNDMEKWMFAIKKEMIIANRGISAAKKFSEAASARSPADGKDESLSDFVEQPIYDDLAEVVFVANTSMPKKTELTRGNNPDDDDVEPPDDNVEFDSVEQPLTDSKYIGNATRCSVLKFFNRRKNKDDETRKKSMLGKCAVPKVPVVPSKGDFDSHKKWPLPPIPVQGDLKGRKRSEPDGIDLRKAADNPTSPEKLPVLKPWQKETNTEKPLECPPWPSGDASEVPAAGIKKMGEADDTPARRKYRASINPTGPYAPELYRASMSLTGPDAPASYRASMIPTGPDAPSSPISKVDPSLYWKSHFFDGTKEDGHAILLNLATDGVYLVRDGTQAGTQVLAVYWNKRIRKYRIGYKEGKYFLTGWNDADLKAETLEEMLFFYHQNYLPFTEAMLTLPYQLALE